MPTILRSWIETACSAGYGPSHQFQSDQGPLPQPDGSGASPFGLPPGEEIHGNVVSPIPTPWSALE